MPLDFPSNPTNGQIYEDYYYDATVGAWNSLGNSEIPNILSNGVFTASSGTTVPLTVNGASGQSANLQEWKSQAGAILASVSANGGLSLNTPLSVQNGGTGTSNLTLNGYLKGTGTSAITSQSGIPANDITGLLSSASVPIGSVIQVVQATQSTAVTTTSQSFVSTGLSASLVPSSTNSKILIICHSGVGHDTRNTFGIFTIYRGSTAGTNLGNGSNGMTSLYPSASATNFTNLSLNFLDSPSTTSSQTYTLAYRVSGGSGTAYAQSQSSLGSMTLLEIKG